MRQKKPRWCVQFRTAGGYSGSQSFHSAESADSAFARYARQGAAALLLAIDGDRTEIVKETANV